MKVLLDFVPNHTSDRHPWFVESRASRKNPRRGWYIWRDSVAGGGPPNNWLSEFGGSAWEFDERTGQYYYHAFLAAQPDLNWRNGEVRDVMHEVIRFWLERGVDGFRVDAIWHLIKDDEFRDNPPSAEFRDGDPPYRRLTPLYSTDRPDVHEVIYGLRAVVDEFPERVLIGEIYLPVEKLVTYYGRNLGGTHLPFNFALIETPWQARAIAALIDRYEAALPKGGWPNWVLGNHDRPRLTTRIGAEQARLAAMLLLTLRGTPPLYYGDEIGMRQVIIPPGKGLDPAASHVPGRDGARTPMQWDASAFAGFSTVQPWLPVADDFATINVASERDNPRSLYNLYRRLLALRRKCAPLTQGSYRPLTVTDSALAYLREAGDEQLMVALNFAAEPSAIALARGQGTILVATHGARDGEMIRGTITLPAHAGAIVVLAS